MGRGKLHEPVGVEGVAAARDVEPKLETLGCRDGGQVRVHRERLLAAHSVLAREMIGAVPLAGARGARVELEAAPSHAHLVPVLEARERGLEAPLSDVAPGAGDIRPDLDVHGFHRG